MSATSFIKKKKKAKLKLSVSTNFYLKAHVLNWEETLTLEQSLESERGSQQ